MELKKQDGKLIFTHDGNDFSVSDARDVVKALGGDIVASDYRKVTVSYDYHIDNPLTHDPEVFVYHKQNRNFKVGEDIEAIGGLEGIREKHPDSVILPLHAYVHSGVAFSLGREYPFNCPWDAGMTGYIVARCDKAAQGAVEMLNHWVQGRCYGYVVWNEWGDWLDSCMGFLGYIDDSGLRENALQHCPDPSKVEWVFYNDARHREEPLDSIE